MRKRSSRILVFLAKVPLNSPKHKNKEEALLMNLLHVHYNLRCFYLMLVWGKTCQLEVKLVYIFCHLECLKSMGKLCYSWTVVLPTQFNVEKQYKIIKREEELFQKMSVSIML